MRAVCRVEGIDHPPACGCPVHQVLEQIAGRCRYPAADEVADLRTDESDRGAERIVIAFQTVDVGN